MKTSAHRKFHVLCNQNLIRIRGENELQDILENMKVFCQSVELQCCTLIHNAFFQCFILY